MTLPDAAPADHDQISPAADKVGSGQFFHLQSVKRLGIEVPIEAFQGFIVGKVRLPDAPCHGALAPSVGLGAQQAIEKAQMRKALLLRPRQHFIQRRGLDRDSQSGEMSLTASLADKTLPVRLRYYANPDLLIIDEFGFDKIERAECPEAAHLLYKIIAARNQKRSTALVTNVDFEKWGEYLSDGPLAMAFLDRLVEGAIILKLKGKSYRADSANALESHSS